MSQVDENALIKRVVEICCTDEITARQYLKLFNWDLDDAVSNLLSNTGESEDDQEPIIHQPEMVSGSNSTSATNIAHPAKPAQKIATLDSISQSAHRAEDPNEESQAFYVGGAEYGGGGQQVLGPPRPKLRNPEEFVRDVFQSAREGGAEILDKNRVDDLEKPSSSSDGQREAFYGTGCRLGECISEPTVKVQGKPMTSRRKVTMMRDDDEGEREEDENSVIVKMWQDGFSLNDGPLRSYTTPESLQFMASIRQGHIPEELAQQSTRNRDVHVLLEDHHTEPWTAPPRPKLKVFSGTGKVLGNPTPIITTTPSASSQQDPVQRSIGPSVDESKPVTQIQVRMPDGSRLLIKLNHDHTVQDLRSAILSERPELQSRAFTLLTTFPRHELTDDTVTVASAQLLNSAILLNQK